MSSWKKAAKTNQKTHRERHQPEARQHLGLLEKKKDYQLRARDAHEKEDTLKLLRKRALNKNPDEFYHHMINAKLDNEGEHNEKDIADDHTGAQIQLMQTQDLKYISMKRTIESNKIRRLQSELHMIDATNAIKNTHTFFVASDDEDAVAGRPFDLAKRLGTHPALLARRTNRTRLADLERMRLPDVDAQTVAGLQRQRDNAYRELSNRVERERELSVAEQKLQLKRALQEKRVLKPRRVRAGTKERAPVYEFKYERKR